ncbi:MAG: sister chromatid cohesion protein PDS5, partial [Candidatus Bathyarchaeota archaeon]
LRRKIAWVLGYYAVHGWLSASVCKTLKPVMPILTRGLVTALNDTHYLVRATAVDSLANLVSSCAKKRLKTTILQFVQLLNDKHREVRIATVKSLGNMGQIAAFLLLIALRDSDWRVREASIKALGKLGPKARLAIPALTNALKDLHISVRIAAALALCKVQKSG